MFKIRARDVVGFLALATACGATSCKRPDVPPITPHANATKLSNGKEFPNDKTPPVSQAPSGITVDKQLTEKYKAAIVAFYKSATMNVKYVGDFRQALEGFDDPKSLLVPVFEVNPGKRWLLISSVATTTQDEPITSSFFISLVNSNPIKRGTMANAADMTITVKFEALEQQPAEFENYMPNGIMTPYDKAWPDLISKQLVNKFLPALVQKLVPPEPQSPTGSAKDFSGPSA